MKCLRVFPAEGRPVSVRKLKRGLDAELSQTKKGGRSGLLLEDG